MTLDEAIKHCEDVARLNEMYCDAEDSVSDRIKCAADHRQLADWLRELKESRAAVKRGQWGGQVLKDDGFGGKSIGYICSVCKQFVPNKGNFCLNCGADMREKEGD